MDYNIQLNDVIQLMMKLLTKEQQDKLTNNENKAKLSEMLDTFDSTSEYFKLGDLVDVRLPENGSWYEGIITKICHKKMQNDRNIIEKDLVFTIKR